MKTLLILRHAKSSWKDVELADHDRPLNKRGKRDAPRMGSLIRDQGLQPDLILSSTAVRARRTAKAAADECGYDGELVLTPELYAFDPAPYLASLAELADDYGTVMIVGHNPAVEELAETLTGEYQRFPTATLAEIQLPIVSWSEIDDSEYGALTNLWRPKEL